MKCEGSFKFKGLQRKEGGTFTNSLGKEISYKDSYSLKLDETTDNGIYERIFKLPTDSTLIEPLLILKPYSDITLEFEVNFYSGGIKLIPISIVK